jgi:LacI family transcriptional regulator
MQGIPRIIAIFDTSHASGRGILTGITKYARLQGPWVFYRNKSQYNHDKKDILTHLKNWHADGIIANLSYTSEIMSLIKKGLPSVIFPVLKSQFKGYNTISADNNAIGAMAAEYFLQRGFKNFGFCGFDLSCYWSSERGESFKAAINQAGHQIAFYSQPARIKVWSREQELLTEWILSLPKPAGIFACNDDRGHDLIEACKIARVRVPDDLSILGVDNDDLVCNMCRTPLSSISINTERAGYESAELLDKLMNGQKSKAQEIIIRPTHVVTRESSDILAIEDNDVAAAMRFIRDNASKAIHVSDVINTVPLSRRVLENRFRKAVGRSLNAQIRRIRVEQVAKMLVETDLSISQIARTLEFECVDHISRYFKKEKGLSLCSFRKMYRSK